jgi:hypothetical protein
MLTNMTSKSFMAYHPAFLLLAAPVVAHFIFNVSPSVELMISIAIAVIAAVTFAFRMTIVAIQFYDHT